MRRWQWSLGRWLRLAAVVSAPTWLLGCGDSPVPIAEQAKSAVAGNEGLALSRKVISEEDLPPAGTRSLFDHVIAQNDGLPYPISKLVKVLQKSTAVDLVAMRAARKGTNEAESEAYDAAHVGGEAASS